MTKQAISGSTVEQPANPTRDNSIFKGWFGVDGKKFDFNTAIATDTDLTAKWILKESSSETEVAKYSNNTTAKIQVKGDETVKDVQAGGLEDLAKALKTEDKNIKLVLEVKSKNETTAPAVEAIENYTRNAGKSDKTISFLDIDLIKYSYVNNIEAATPTDITDTAILIEVVIPYDESNKKNTEVYRYHDGVEPFVKKDLAEECTRDAVFYIEHQGTSKAVIHLFSTKFSTYAITYDVEETQKQEPTYYYTPETYTVSVPEAKNGTVTVSSKSAEAGSTVTLTVTPDKGYTLETITVTDKNGNEIELTAVIVGEKYTFKMPSGAVSISATFMEDNTMLNYFVDVTAGDYFYDAVLWAAQTGVTDGVDETHFAPLSITSRAQMVTFLWRAAGSPEPTTTVCPFTDIEEGTFYYKAVLWAYENDITEGTSLTEFSPNNTVTRGQAVTFLARTAKAAAGEYTHSFIDVPDGQFYSDAVAWAYAKKITKGTSDTTFSPYDECLRGQIVTFLYNYFAM